MDRRAFLSSAGAAAIVATGGLGASRKLYAQSSYDPNVLDNAVTAHSSVIARSFNGLGQPWDFRTLANAQSSVANTFLQGNFDAQLKSQIANVPASALNPANNDYTGAVQRIQAYAPDFQADDLQYLLNYISNDPDSVASTLDNLKQNGLVPTIQASAPVYMQMYHDLVNLGDEGMAALRSPFLNRNPKLAKYRQSQEKPKIALATYDPARDKPHMERATWQRPLMFLPPSSGGGYSCAADGMAGLAYGTAIAVVTTMCVLSVIGDVLCLPMLLYWAGTGGAAWGLGHAVKCGF